jgi:hypothetical protein
MSNTYYVCTLIKHGHAIFINHVQIPHSIFRNFLDHRFSRWWVENWAFIVLFPTNNTHNSAIYKLTSRPVGWLAQHCTYIVLCPPNNTRSFAIYKLTDGLQGWQVQDCHCLRMVIPLNYLT